MRDNEQTQNRVLRECGDALVAFYEDSGRPTLGDPYREGATTR